MARFNAGDRVVVNKSMVATVKVYDENLGRLVLEQDLGGSTNQIYGPIESYDLELLVQPAVTAQPEQVQEPVQEPAQEPEQQQDELTTLDNLS